MRNALCCLLLLSSAVGCGVPERDARSLLEGVEAIASADPADKTVLLVNMCGELPSCIDRCKETLQALGSVAAENRVGIVAQDCDPSAASLPHTREGFDLWLDGYIDRYVTKARGALPEADRKRLDAAWAKSRFTKT